MNLSGMLHTPIVRKNTIILSIGVCVGISFSYFLMAVTTITPPPVERRVRPPPYLGPPRILSRLGDQKALYTDDDVVARQLAKEVRILCWINTYPETHLSKARHVKATWGKRCNTLLFMSTSDDAELGTVNLNVSSDRQTLWQRAKLTMQYVYAHHLDDADWFLKADDDTYVIMENLRYMLSAYNTTDPIYFGCRFKDRNRDGYPTGGAGHVLSKEALKQVVLQGLPDPSKCTSGNRAGDDVELGYCLENVGIQAGDSRDTFGRGRFFNYPIENDLVPNLQTPFGPNLSYFSVTEGMECCSDSAVSFHYVSANQMYVMDYLLYYLRPYGIVHQADDFALATTQTILSESDGVTK